MFHGKTLGAVAVVLVLLLSLGSTVVGAGDAGVASGAVDASAVGAALQQTTESEPNDDPGTANPIESGAAVSGAVSEPTDIDAFSLTVEADRTIETNLTRTSGDGLLAIVVYGPDGNPVSAVLAEPGATTQLSAQANATGRYDVVIAAASTFGVEGPNADGTGDYLLEVDVRSVDEGVFNFPTETGTERVTTDVGTERATTEAPAASVPTTGAATTTAAPTTSAGGPANAVAETEPNEGPTAANDAAVGDTIRGTIADANDVDWYRIELGAGESVRLSLARPSGSGTMIFGVVTPGGEPLTAGFVNASETVELTADGVDAGTYYVLVGPVEENPGTGPYTLTLAGDALLPDTLAEQEPNDSPGLATALALGTTMSGVLSSPEDVDVYALQMESGRTYNVTVTRETAGGTFGLGLLRPSGAFVSIGGDDVFSTPYVETYLTYEAGETGTFYLVVMAGDATGPYTVTMAEEASTTFGDRSAQSADAQSADAQSADVRTECPADGNPYVVAFTDPACVPTAE